MVVLFVALILAFARVGAAQVSVLGDAERGRVTVDAESLAYDEATGTVTAKGKVVIRRGESELRAEQVEVNNATSEAHAVGDVVFTVPEGSLGAREMRLNLKEETGTLISGWVRSERYQYSLRGDRIEKGHGQHYRIENGEFTTCDCDGGVPSWSLSAKRVTIELDGYGHLERGTFNVRGWPILYLPRATFPVTRERRSGFLLPHFGFSNRRGFQTIAPFYFAINRSQDATLALDFESGARAGLLGQYRYALSRDSHGRIDLSYFDEVFRSAAERRKTDRPVADLTIPRHRWSVIGWHAQKLPLGAVGYADTFLVSDDLFLREINTFELDGGEHIFSRTRRYTKSRVGLLRTWNRAALRLEGAYYQDLIQADEVTLQQVPEVAFWGQRLLGGIAHAKLDATATAFQRREGIDGLRVDFHPAVAVNVPTGLPLRVALRLGLRETAYALTQRRMRGGLDPDSTADWVLELPTAVSRQVVELGGEVTTELARVYHVGGQRLQRLKHTIEPVLAYDYVPDVGQDDLPLFDAVDRVNRRNLITFGFRSRLLGRYGAKNGAGGERDSRAEVRELASLSVLQSLDVNRQIAPVGEPPGGPTSDHFSDIDLLLRTSPWPSTTLLLRSSYDTSDEDISAAAVALRFTDPRRHGDRRGGRLSNRTTVTLGYRFITQNILQQLDASLLLRVTDFLGVLYATRYDLQNNEVLEHHVGVRLLSRCDCWGFDIGFTDKTNPSETEVRAQLTLSGFGSSVRIGRGLQ